jgi:hypothetical protein
MVEQRRVGQGLAGQALLAEATILARCRHPGVVDLRRVDTDGDEVAVTTAVPSGPRLHDARLSTEEMAGVAAVIATTIADLHDIGVAHGALSAGSVIITDDGRAVIDGFSSARPIDGSPARWARHPLSRADDRALGGLLSDLLAAGSREQRSPMGGRFPFRRRARRGDAAVTLAGWVDAAARGEVTSRRLAEAMAEDVPGARLPLRVGDRFEDVEAADLGVAAGPTPEAADFGLAADPTPEARPDETDPEAPPDEADPEAPPATANPEASLRPPDTDLDAGPLDPWAADPSASEAAATHAAPFVFRAAVALTVLAGLAAAASLLHRPAHHPSSAPRPPATRSAVCITPSSTAACAVPVVTVGTRRFRVGQPGDVVATGRWDCRATPTLALLRPSSQTIWRFTAWPADGTVGHPLTVAIVPRARTLHPAPHGACDTLVVGRDGGTSVDLGPWPAP